MINNYNNGLIARKADGEILMFNEDGDWGNHFKEVKSSWIETAKVQFWINME